MAHTLVIHTRLDVSPSLPMPYSLPSCWSSPQTRPHPSIASSSPSPASPSSTLFSQPQGSSSFHSSPFSSPSPSPSSSPSPSPSLSPSSSLTPPLPSTHTLPSSSPSLLPQLWLGPCWEVSSAGMCYAGLFQLPVRRGERDVQAGEMVGERAAQARGNVQVNGAALEAK